LVRDPNGSQADDQRSGIEEKKMISSKIKIGLLVTAHVVAGLALAWANYSSTVRHDPALDNRRRVPRNHRRLLLVGRSILRLAAGAWGSNCGRTPADTTSLLTRATGRATIIRAITG
jgi:hypothetical protein